MRFGENFPQGADPKNRIDVLKNKENLQDVPEHVRFSLEIRDKLRSKVELEGWPDLPELEELNKTQDIFEVAKSEVDRAWEESIQDIINEKAVAWSKNLDINNLEEKQASDLLNNPEELKSSFSTRQFGVLEVLRKSNPEAWLMLIMASSEKQLASIAIMEHWLRDSDKDKLAVVCEKVGLNIEELSLFVDSAAILGKYVDHVYIKQIQLADLPGGSKETKLGEKEGSQYLYDLYRTPESDDIDIKTYSDIFPYEWEKIKSRLNYLADRTNQKIEEGKISESFRGYSVLLEKMSQVYGSKDIRPEFVEREWSELYKIAKKIDDTDCPLVIVPQGCASVSGEAGKVDVEIRLGLKTREIKEQERGLDNFTQIAQTMLNGYQDALSKEYGVPKITLNYQAWAFGPNLYWHTRGESSEDQIVSHINAVSEVAIAQELPLVKRLFRNERISEEEYANASVVETVLHETGHNIIDYSDKRVSKRTGRSFEVEILEELKAEILGMKILFEAMEKNKVLENVNLRAQLLAKVGTNLNYLKNKSSKKSDSGEPYYISGAAIIGRLLEKGLLIKTGDCYELGDTNTCIKEIADISQEILPLYIDNQSKSGDVKNYVNNLRHKSQESSLTDLKFGL